MKNLLFRTIRFVLSPIIYCHRIIMEAPVVCCDDELMCFGDYNRFCMPEEHAKALREEPGSFVNLSFHTR